MKHTHTETDLPIENQYPKLVRDKIPEMIERQGKKAEYHLEENDEEYLSYLFAKLLEEATELSQAEGSDHQKEEVADVREVISAIQLALGITEPEIKEVQASKREERGGFTGRFILDSLPE
ncbi:nucleoside triphosphate pyrophosphohydrolase [Candidatus Saccharibacteria bacterium]|nr:nucleoside triphosphate pyrophosphohydrolase [Candidatus Saccharibacteria bacterium]MBI3338312.1 nucleoside triphosphate pyrophosphohydrolase [Candidatus Saccharibacteria bacterium]